MLTGKFPVKRNVFTNHARSFEPRAHIYESALPDLLPEFRVRCERSNGVSHAGLILDCFKNRRSPQRLNEWRNITGYNRAAARLCLDGRPPESFIT